MDAVKRKVLLGTKFLSFELLKEEYCIEIRNVKEILGIPEITPVPQSPDFIRGVMNLRGSIIPVIDLRLKFGLPLREYNDRTCVIVVETGTDASTVLIGVIVDTIHEVIAIPDERITRIPYLNARIRSEYIQGFYETGDRLRILLDIRKILSEEELSAVDSIEQHTDPKGEDR